MLFTLGLGLESPTSPRLVGWVPYNSSVEVKYLVLQYFLPFPFAQILLLLYILIPIT